MRTIKFRAWDGVYMYVPVYHVDNWHRNFTDTENDVPTADPIMEYTGQNDVDNKEIYEDDWCEAQFRDQNGIKVIQGRIIMHDYGWCIDCRGCIGDDIFSIDGPHAFKILGNIYQNKELTQ